MNTALGAALIFLALGAGPSSTPGVAVDHARREASGRAAKPGTGEQIQCRVHTALGLRAAECYAQDGAGTEASCTTRDEDLFEAALAARGASFLRFAWDERGDCISIETTKTPVVS